MQRITTIEDRLGYAVRHLGWCHSEVRNYARPFKEYGKTDPVDLPPVKAQVLRGGKLIEAPAR